MDKLETERLVRKLAVLDNRQVNDGVVESWHELIGYLSYEVAKRSLVKAQQDVNIKWVEPKHVLAKSYEVTKELNEEASKSAREFDDYREGDPQPRCAEHGALITACLPCCSKIYRKSLEVSPSVLSAWIDEHVYEVAS